MLRTDDIEGAQPKVLKWRRDNVEERPEDSRPAKPYYSKFPGKPDSFNVDDIEGAQPRTSCFRTTRAVNPLNPEYKLPSYKELEFEELRFVRDPMPVDDIEGAKPRSNIKASNRREFYGVDDIEGANASWKSHRARVIEKLRDRSRLQRCANTFEKRVTGGFNAKGRCTNPLQPIYSIHGTEHRDCPRGTAPKRVTKEKKSPFFSLQTADILGAQGGTASAFKRLRVLERRHFAKTNDVKDIPGAQTDTLIRGLVSKRCTDPLQPNYTFLHGGKTPTPRPGDKDGEDLLRSLDHHKNPALAKKHSKGQSSEPFLKPSNVAATMPSSEHKHSQSKARRPSSAPLDRQNTFARTQSCSSGIGSSRTTFSSSGRSSSRRPSSATLFSMQKNTKHKQAEIDAVRNLPNW